MLLTITTTHQPANELGFLLQKHPERFQSFDMSFGKVHDYCPVQHLDPPRLSAFE